MNRIRPCWAPLGRRPAVAAQLIRQYIYLYGVVSPKDGTCVLLDYADLEYGKLPGLPPSVGTQVRPARYLACSRRRAQPSLWRPSVPRNIRLLYFSPYSPELNPKENLWDEIREKIFKNFALKSMDAVRAKLRQAILYLEQNPTLVSSITSFPYIVNSL